VSGEFAEDRVVVVISERGLETLRRRPPWPGDGNILAACEEAEFRRERVKELSAEGKEA